MAPRLKILAYVQHIKSGIRDVQDTYTANKKTTG